MNRIGTQKSISISMFLLLFLFALSCSNRDRDNPFDPNNPDTGGEPFVFNGIADDERAHLSWSATDLDDLEGFLLVRTVLEGGSPDDSARYTLQANQTVYQDKNLTNGTRYLYRLGFIFDGEPAWTNSDTLTPGSAVPWVLDGYAGVLIRLSPDGRDRAASYSMSSVFSDLDIVPTDESCWVADYFNKRVYHIDIEGEKIEEIELTGYPVAIGVDELRRRVWVSQTEPAALIRYTFGHPDATYEISDYPLSISIDQGSGSLWACSPGGGTVIQVDDQGLRRSSGYDSPRAIVYDPSQRLAWVATRSAVLSLNDEFEQVNYIGNLSYPEDIALDIERGHIWIADTGNARILKYNRNSVLLRSFSDFTEPYSLAFDTLSEECWITDSFAGQVVRVSGDGRYLKRMDGFLNPFGIAVIP